MVADRCCNKREKNYKALHQKCKSVENWLDFLTRKWMIMALSWAQLVVLCKLLSSQELNHQSANKAAYILQASSEYYIDFNDSLKQVIAELNCCVIIDLNFMERIHLTQQFNRRKKIQ